MTKKFNFQSFQSNLSNADFFSQQSNDEIKQAIEHSQFNPLQLIELIDAAQIKRIKSLLIIQLLSSAKYLAALKGTSILSRINAGVAHTPSRLNAWIQQLDVSLLTEEMIHSLEPEAAVSILFFYPHFQSLNSDQVCQLISRYPQSALIFNWINTCALKPGAQLMLPHFFKWANEQTLAAIAKMSSPIKDQVVRRILLNLDLYSVIPKFLYTEHEQRNLQTVLHTYLDGHTHANNIAFIQQICFKLKHTNFSTELLQLLIALKPKAEFKELNQRLAQQCNQHLKRKAELGVSDVFYYNDTLNIDLIRSELYFDSPVDPQDTSLIATIRSLPQSIDCLSYFVIHCTRDSLIVRQLLDDFLQKLDPQIDMKYVHRLALLMNKAIDPLMRKVIFDSLLNNPQLFDECICKQLFVYDAEAAVRFYGNQCHYEQVIGLCTLARAKLNSPALISIAETAQREAGFELELSKSGFLTYLFSRFVRGWSQGWTKIFTPQMPTYVAPYTMQSINEEVEEESEEESSPSEFDDSNKRTQYFDDLRQSLPADDLIPFLMALSDDNPELSALGELNNPVPELDPRIDLSSADPTPGAILDQAVTTARTVASSWTATLGGFLKQLNASSQQGSAEHSQAPYDSSHDSVVKF